jgi:tetratricopeptide (TPR) repeat protein
LEDMEYDEATNIFHNILEDYPYNESALRGLARSSFLSHDYEQSVESYSELFKCNPENRNIALNYCMSLIKVKDNESALNILYKLNYEYLDDINVIRVLAWALLAENKLEQAETEYNKLLKNKKITPSDYINAGYCQWFKGNVTSAVKLFRTFVNKSHGSNDLKESILDDEFANDRQMIHLHGISEIEVRIMIDICNADFDA